MSMYSSEEEGVMDYPGEGIEEVVVDLEGARRLAHEQCGGIVREIKAPASRVSAPDLRFRLESARAGLRLAAFAGDRYDLAAVREKAADLESLLPQILQFIEHDFTRVWVALHVRLPFEHDQAVLFRQVGDLAGALGKFRKAVKDAERGGAESWKALFATGDVAVAGREDGDAGVFWEMMRALDYLIGTIDCSTRNRLQNGQRKET